MDFVGQFELLARAEQPDEIKVGELIMAMAAESIDHIRQLLARLTAGTSQITARQHLSLYCRALARCQQEGAERLKAICEATLDVLQPRSLSFEDQGKKNSPHLTLVSTYFELKWIERGREEFDSRKM